MKSLIESILGSSRAGKNGLIESWCKEHNLEIDKITNNGEVKLKQQKPRVEFFEDYDEIPEYITFAADDTLEIMIYGNKVKSYRGLPTKVYSTTIKCEDDTIKDLNIESDYINWRAKNAKKFINCSIKTNSLKIYDANSYMLDNLPIKDRIGLLDLVIGGYYARQFTEIMSDRNLKPAINRRDRNDVIIAKTPLSDDTYDELVRIFSKNIDKFDIVRGPYFGTAMQFMLIKGYNADNANKLSNADKNKFYCTTYS